MPIEFKKKNLTCCDLIDLPFDFQTDYETLAQSLDAVDYWKEWPFLYDNTRVLQIQHLTENFQNHSVGLIRQMVKEVGFDTVNGMLFELKYKKKKKEEESAD